MSNKFKEEIKSKVQAIKDANDMLLARRIHSPRALKSFEIALESLQDSKASIWQTDKLLALYANMINGDMSHDEAVEASIWIYGDGLFTDNAKIIAAVEKALKQGVN